MRIVSRAVAVDIGEKRRGGYGNEPPSSLYVGNSRKYILLVSVLRVLISQRRFCSSVQIDCEQMMR